jgi:hypothetical protein
LLEIRTWDEVVIVGQEMRVIKAYHEDGDYIGDCVMVNKRLNTLIAEP